MNDVVIVCAVRTPVGSFGGALAQTSAVELGALVLQEALRRAGPEAPAVEQVIMGNVLQAGLGQNTARQAALRAGFSVEVPAWTLNMVCGSSLLSVIQAAQAVRVGMARCVLAGGMENMSAAPYLLPTARWGARMGDGQITDSMLCDGLWDAFNHYHMGITAENVAARYGLSREELDAYALDSQMRAATARAEGKFREEIIPVQVRDKKQTRTCADDEFIRPDTTLEKLAQLKPAFSPEGVVTAGNASGINDGAAALLLMDAALAEQHGMRPLARIVEWALAGVDPAFMGLGPVPATRRALEKAGWDMASLDLVEANEAFAAQFLAVCRELELKPDIVNVNGGAIALGHPIGASGSRILTTLLYGLRRCGGKRGLATLCVGGGQGVALLVETC